MSEADTDREQRETEILPDLELRESEAEEVKGGGTPQDIQVVKNVDKSSP